MTSAQKITDTALAHNSAPVVFDRKRVRRNRERCRKKFTSHGFLFDWSARELGERLLLINRNFLKAVFLGSRAVQSIAIPKGKIGSAVVMDSCLPYSSLPFPSVVADEESLPFAAGNLDLLLSNLTLHTVNDLPGALIQIKRSLKPDGLFLAAMFGGETLHELRACLMEAEMELRGGISPRVAPFADKQQAGALLQRAGYALPVVDSEILTVTYPNLLALMRDLKGMGESNALAHRDKSFTGKNLFIRAEEIYRQRYGEADGRLRASFEILFLIGWAPHYSQQKPLRPGSAEHSLADALSTEEIKAGEQAKP